jgi:hypothetical protein
LAATAAVPRAYAADSDALLWDDDGTDEIVAIMLRRTSDADPAWVELGTKRGIRIWKAAAGTDGQEGGGAGVAVRGRGRIDVSVATAMGRIRDSAKKAVWDGMFVTSRVVEQVNPRTKIQQECFKGIWPVAGRDFCTIQTVRMFPDGTGVLAGTSRVDPRCAEKAPYVRGECVIAGFVIRPADGEGDRACVVDYISHADLKGSVPAFILEKVATNQPMNVATLREVCQNLTPTECNRYAVEGLAGTEPPPPPPPTTTTTQSLPLLSSPHPQPDAMARGTSQAAATPDDGSDELVHQMLIRTANDDDTTEWTDIGTSRGVRRWKGAKTVGSEVAVRGRTRIDVSLETVLGVVRDTSIKATWDDMFVTSCVIEEVAGGQTKIQQECFKGIWPVAGRDFCTIQTVRIRPDGTLVMAGGSIADRRCPEASPYVRGECTLAGFVVRPLLDDGSACVVDYISHADLHSNVPAFILAKVAERQLMNVARIRDICEKLSPAERKRFAAEGIDGIAPEFDPDSDPTTPAAGAGLVSAHLIEQASGQGARAAAAPAPAPVASAAVPDDGSDRFVTSILQRTANDGDTSAWTDIGTTRGVHKWKGASPKGSEVAVRGRATIRVPLETVMGVVRDTSIKATWDDMFVTSCVIEEVAGGQTKIQQECFKGIWPVAGRDFCTIQTVRIRPDGTLVMAGGSIADRRCPEASPYVRGEAFLAGFVVRSIDDGSSCVVDYISHADLHSNVPAFILAKVAERQLMNVARIRDICEKLSPAERKRFAAEGMDGITPGPPLPQAAAAAVHVVAPSPALSGSEEGAAADRAGSGGEPDEATEAVDSLLSGDGTGDSALLADPCMFNTDKIRRACIPSANGHFSARALAKFYGCLANGGSLNGASILSPEMVAAMAVTKATMEGQHGMPASEWGLGVRKYGATAFGHGGLGGSLALCDPAHKFSIAITLNKLTLDREVATQVLRRVCEALDIPMLDGLDEGAFSTT